MDQINEIQKPRAEKLALTPSSDFNYSIINLWSQANDHTTFQLQYQDPNIAAVNRVKRNDCQTGTVIIIPDIPNLGDLCQAARLLQGEEANKPVLDFAKKLKDSAILLSKQQLFSGENSDEVIEYLFQLGSILDGELIGNENNSTPPKRQIISEMKITINQGIDQNNYENQLYLFLLGKNIVLNYQPDDVYLQKSAEKTFYSTLYERWAYKYKRKGNFDNWLLNHKQLLVALLVPYTSTVLLIVMVEADKL